MLEVAGKLLNRLEELLIEGRIPASVVQQTITNIKAEGELVLLFEIVELLSEKRISKKGTQQFKDEIANLVKITTNELLGGIKNLLNAKQTPSDSSNRSAADAELDTVHQMNIVFEQMLVANGISQDHAMQAISHLGHDLVNELLVFTDLKAIRTHKNKDLLIKIDITSIQKNTFTSLIIEALKRGKYKLRKVET